MTLRIVRFVLRLAALAALVLGVLFWTGHALQLRQVHMTAGILVVIALWAIAFVAVTRGGPVEGAVAAVVVGVLLAVVGMTQERLLPGAGHWVIQVGHVALALAAVGIGEALAGRATRATRATRVRAAAGVARR